MTLPQFLDTTEQFHLIEDKGSNPAVSGALRAQCEVGLFVHAMLPMGLLLPQCSHRHPAEC
jgi:hypothetical protein